MLHDKKQSVRSLDCFVKLDDVGMADHFQNVDLSADSLYIVNVCDLALVEQFDGHLAKPQVRQSYGTYFLAC